MFLPGADIDGGAGSSSDMAAIGDEDSRVREGGGSGGNRWPRQETLALLEIRSNMDAVFRDSSLKGPLWEQVSRKMGELGYNRSGKKCREKFENVYKYHKRTKDSRAAKGPDKTYRFSDQLKALESTTHPSSSLFALTGAASPPVESAVPIAMAMPPPRASPQPVAFQLLPIASSSSTSSDEGATRRKKKKTKWKGLFERMTETVIKKQEEVQRKFLEAMERREKGRRVREEGWKKQEISRLKGEQKIVVEERCMGARRDAALTSFLQRLSEQHQIPLPPAPVTTPASGGVEMAEGGLINLRTGMESKYQEGGPKCSGTPAGRRSRS